jgi:hypothetical protein
VDENKQTLYAAQNQLTKPNTIEQVIPTGNASTLTVPPAQHRALNKHDMVDLKRSGLTEASISAMGCYSVSKDEIRESTGVKVPSGGYAIPYPGLNDQTGRPLLRYRLQNPKTG